MAEQREQGEASALSVFMHREYTSVSQRYWARRERESQAAAA